jgi:hypothetical protein
MHRTTFFTMADVATQLRAESAEIALMPGEDMYFEGTGPTCAGGD